MGQSPSSQTSETQRKRFRQMFANNFELVPGLQHDPLFGEVVYFKNKNLGVVQIIMKTIVGNDITEIEKIVAMLENRVVDPIPNLLSVYHVDIQRQSLLCGSISTAKIYFQYLQKSLKEELKKRRRHKSYYFSEQQLWKIFISLINAIQHLHALKIFHGEIRLENVLIDGDYHMKLVEKGLLNVGGGWKVETEGKVRLEGGRGIYFSPCILKCLSHQRTQLASYDPFKGDIFAIGMIMLECASLKHGQDFYDYEQFTIKLKEIQFVVYDLRGKYNYDLINLIQKMLEQNDEDRPSAVEIYDKIKKIPNETIRELNMTLNQSFLNESIRSYM